MCDPNVKPKDRRPLQHVCAWIDRHPRTGWYITFWGICIIAFNFIVNVWQLFGG